MDQKKQILDIVLKHLRSNVVGIEDLEIDTRRPFEDYGATSMDLVEIVMSVMRDLELSVPRTQLAGVSNVDELVELFARLKSQGT